ncbi:SAM-dependent methyltransferase [Verrucosispora sp. WMMC514]|uniref:SAM-dependent methyltransferase n=1 Tax=Verrucosispora sp. WMMC514 TaxID=3015156 RepID=UPI00248B1CA9|nr:SAM-dependent methyltransferase [Verrucosispora sp. WMMC514]WBB93073.1 SAM-dependent methyltransferase [Verrucosispora sp. WMMC514]
MSMRWREAMRRALYGPEGFFVSGAGPAAHFRTSVHASPVFTSALLRLIHHLDAALGFPDRFDVVDVGAGGGELLNALSVGVAGEPARSGRSGLIPARAGSPATLTTTAAVRPGRGGVSSESVGPSRSAPVPLARRVRFTAVELAPRPAHLPDQITWTNEIPTAVTGLLLATEWLDNIPLDLATQVNDRWHYLLVDPTSGEETTGEQINPADLDWLTTWWPTPTERTPGARTRTDDPDLPQQTATDGSAPTTSGFRAARPAQGSSLTARSRPGCPETPTDRTPTDRTPTDRTPTRIPPMGRAEIGRTRDEAWADAVGRVDRGLALAVDYGHLHAERPIDGSLTGYRAGRQVPPVPDGSCDVTAHVAIDSVAAAGERVARCAYLLTSQREALRALGADGGRPPLSLAASDPAGYLRALATASAAAELTDPAGLGGHWWLWQPVGLPTDRLPPLAAPTDRPDGQHG